jgi:hypothetical protein
MAPSPGSLKKLRGAYWRPTTTDARTYEHNVSGYQISFQKIKSTATVRTSTELLSITQALLSSDGFSFLDTLKFLPILNLLQLPI